MFLRFFGLIFMED